MSTTAETREQWLELGIEALRALFDGLDHAPPERVHVSIGFPLGSRKAIGQCYTGDCSEDGAPHVFVSPVLDDPVKILDTLAHELCHTALPKTAKHGAQFAALAQAIGLEGPARATSAGADLNRKLHAIAHILGPLPHSRLDPFTARKVQTTRMVKCQCGTCGYSVRTTRHWIAMSGAPGCGNVEHGRMVVCANPLEPKAN